MSNLDIRISITQIRADNKALQRRIGKKALISMIQAFSEYVMVLYLDLIEEAIDSNRYKGNWEPVDDPGYREYLGTRPSGSILLLIADALEVKKIGYNFIIRINPQYVYPGSDLSLYKVLRAIDNGTSKFNARPIFSKILREINSNTDELWRGYLLRKGVL